MRRQTSPVVLPPIPSTITVETSVGPWPVAIDVQAVDGCARLQAIDLARIGTHASVETAASLLGSVGAIVELPDGILGAVTAGHVAQLARGSDLVAATANTRIPLGHPMSNATGREMLLVNDRADIAIVGPVDGDVEGIAGDLLFVRDPTGADVNQRVWVHVLREFPPVAAYVHGVDVRATFFRVDGPGEIDISGLVELDAVTQGGDSGAPVVDDSDNIIGFVVGSDRFRTYVMPARRGLYELEASVL